MSSRLFLPWRLCRVATILISIFASQTWAQTLDFSVSPSPVGSGARAAGMADAFVSIADDATAASWNPAGLVQLERPELSVVGSFIGGTEKLMATQGAGFESTARGSSAALNFLSFTYPLPFLIFGKNSAVSLSYQQKYDLTRQFDVTFSFQRFLNRGGPIEILTDLDVDFDQEGSLSTITPAFAIEITNTLSIGVAYNLWRNPFTSANGWTQDVTLVNRTSIGGFDQPVTTRSVREEYKDFKGENFTLGVLWRATEKLNLGARYDFGFKGDIKYERLETGTIVPEPLFDQEDREMRFPDSATIAVSYRINDRLTIALDVGRTDWNDFLIETADGERISLVTGESVDDPDTASLDPTYTVRIGGEYIFIPKRPREQLSKLWTVRGGIFFDQEPASGRPATGTGGPGNGKPDNFYGFAAGAGLQLFNRFNVDLAYQFRYGSGVNGDLIRGAEGFEEDIFQHRVLLSTVIYF